jgi:type I restriction enzyme, R subunit
VNGRPLADYNNEKDALTIEKTFAVLLVRVEELDNEQRRAVSEGLTDEPQALVDLLIKPNLRKADIKRLKAVAVGLYEPLQAQIDEIQDFTSTEQTRSDIKVMIRNYL